MVIESSIEPDTWFDLSETGEGAITTSGDSKLVIWQTREKNDREKKTMEKSLRDTSDELSVVVRELETTKTRLANKECDSDGVQGLRQIIDRIAEIRSTLAGRTRFDPEVPGD